MVYKLGKSFVVLLKDRGLVTDYAATVTRFCEEVNSWFTREKEVKEQPPLPPKPQWSDFEKSPDPAAAYTEANRNWAALRLEHKDPFKRPSAHPDIESSVRYDEESDKFIEDYEIINDDPSPEAVLEAKKAELIISIHAAASEARKKVELSPGRQRLSLITEREIASADNAYAQSLPSGFTPDEIKKKVDENRCDEHRAFFDDRNDRSKRLAKIELDEAHAMVAVEDLTVDQIDSFTLPVFET